MSLFPAEYCGGGLRKEEVGALFAGGWTDLQSGIEDKSGMELKEGRRGSVFLREARFLGRESVLRWMYLQTSYGHTYITRHPRNL